MVRRRLVTIVVIACAAAGVLAYLRDPPWLIGRSSGLRGWEQQPGGPRYRWSGGHASFFVRSDAGEIAFPISTTFDGHDSRPMTVTVSVDDRPVGRTVLAGPAWAAVRIALPPPGGRSVRRIDVRTSVTREGNRGVRIGEVESVRR